MGKIYKVNIKTEKTDIWSEGTQVTTGKFQDGAFKISIKESGNTLEYKGKLVNDNIFEGTFALKAGFFGNGITGSWKLTKIK